MSLPPGFLDELRSRSSLTQVVGRKVMWDARKSNQGKGDMWAPCPFHQEKSASFHVDDRQGFYYCFGCHAKGDAITFIRETENVSFMEAVEILAGEVGMPMPARDPKAQQKSDKRSELAEVTEAAVRFFRMSLSQGAGAAARDYLDGRGMSQETRDRFEIGYAPNGNALLAHLKDNGISEELAIEAGVAAKPDDGRGAYDFYRDRIIFPIRDPRGRAISFGGRSMDPNARAKYLNGPERLLFDKGAALYNHGGARTACGKGQTLVVAEGYMDVIALSEAGFEATVAPLGTAVTERQLQLMWRMHPEPVIALDGDKAGLRAAMRVIDLAMPLLEAGKSLRFAIMPEGKDPDDLIKAEGRAGMRAVLEGAVPMVSLLWQRETSGKVFDSPERRAMLDKALRDAITPIKDRSIKRHYGEILKDMRFELFQSKRTQSETALSDPFAGGFDLDMPPAPEYGAGYDDRYVPSNSGPSDAPSYGEQNFNGDGRGSGPKRRSNFEDRPKRVWDAKTKSFKLPAVPVPSTKSSVINSTDEAYVDFLREAVILATALRNPSVILDFESKLESLHPSDADHAKILHALLTHADETDAQALWGKVCADCTAPALDRLMAHPHVQIAPAVKRPDIEMAQMCLSEELAKLKARRGYSTELKDGILDMVAADDENVTWRLAQAAEARNKATKAEAEDRAEYDIGANGAEMKREERRALDDLIASLSISKGAGGGAK
ncbi:DNA primase [Pacificibacter maritimus]|uniref:DNA primase n=1 Tax=Pacificibacter maritimus TaxID=762213 RepID=A0A3N4UWU1_9RHOB|nr:DNA primase [Pacificibacter maritimus]RPE72009.1 DNA primase [Pacificibacter maritimus]